MAFLVSIAGIKKNYSKNKYYIPVLVCSVSLLAFQYIPFRSNDLMRYYQAIEVVGKMDFTEAMDYFADGLAVKNLLFWIFGKLDMPQLLPFLTACVVYGVLAYITYDATKIYGCEKDTLKILVIQFMSISFFGQLSTVRSCMAYALIMLAVYLDLVKKKRNLFTIAVYLIPCFIHITSVLFIGIRFLFFISYKLRWIMAMGITILGVMELISNTSLSMLFGPYVEKFFFKWRYYLHEDSSSAWASLVDHNLPYQVYKLVVLCFVVTFIYMFFLVRKREMHKEPEKKALDTFRCFVFVLCAVTCFAILFMHGNNSDRFFTIVIIGSGCILVPVFGSHDAFQKGYYLMMARVAMLLYLIPLKVYHIHIDTWSVNWKEMIISYSQYNLYRIILDMILGIV